MRQKNRDKQQTGYVSDSEHKNDKEMESDIEIFFDMLYL